GVGYIGFECPTDQGCFHINSETNVMEIVGENETRMTEGSEGELVITSFAYTLNPVVRYAHNDMGRIFNHPCGCGRTLPLFKFYGRRGHEIILPSGRKIRMMYLYRLHSGVLMGEARLGRLAKQFQIIQNRIDNLLLLIVPRRKISDADEIKIRLAITELFNGEKMNIEIEYVDVIPNGRGHKPSFFIPLSEFQERKL
ncbi:MAG: hypothetical protein Q8Q89_05350, partial [bacterium]|nr:hypothetical protein [bacterium]